MRVDFDGRDKSRPVCAGSPVSKCARFLDTTTNKPVIMYFLRRGLFGAVPYLLADDTKRGLPLDNLRVVPSLN
jgi:hypothetical protein